VADEDLTLDGGEAADTSEEVVVEQPDDTPEPVANLAKELGWVPKDQFRGDPNAWKPADQFILDGHDIQQSTARELRSLRKQMERIGGVTETIVQTKVAEARAEWEAKFNQAVEDGDTATAKKLVREQPNPSPQTGGPDPQVTGWIAKNQWFNSDPLAQARAQELSDRLKHLPVADQLTQVERAIRKEFPEHFPAPAKQPPATQTAAARNPNPSNRVKGFADMPQASQQVAREMVERHPGLKLEDIAKSYWGDPANQRRA
jgi:hypothetical protein